MTKRTRMRQRALIEAYPEVGLITKASEVAGVSRNAHYHWIKKYPRYRRKFDDAEARFVEKLEAECDRRAVEGVDEPVFYEGKECGTRKRYSDTLLMFRLKKLRPNEYREKERGDTNVAVGVKVEVSTDDLSGFLAQTAQRVGGHVTDHGTAAPTFSTSSTSVAPEVVRSELEPM